MRYLAACIAGALFSQQSMAGDLTWSPTVELGAHQVKVDSDNPVLERQDTVLSADLLLHGAYDSKKYKGELEAHHRYYKYSDYSRTDLNFTDIRFDNTLDLWRDDLILDVTWQQRHELFDTIQGSFADDVYSEDSRIRFFHRDYALRYDIPAQFDIDGNVRYTHREQSAKALSDDLSARDKDRLQGNYENREFQSRFGQYDGNFPWYWVVDLAREEQIRQDDNRFVAHRADVVTRIPVVLGVNIVGTGQYSHHENPDSWRFGLADEPIEHRVWGAGLAWVKHPDTAFIQITHEWDTVNDTTFWSAHARWQFADRWSAEARTLKRFYGDSYQASIQYRTLNSDFRVGYDEDIELRYFLVPNFQNEGVYICSPGEDVFSGFDPELCRLSDGISEALPVGDVLLTRNEVTFPLVERLTLHKEWNLEWDYDNGKWTHSLHAFHLDMDDLEFNNGQITDEVYFQGDWRLNSRSYLRTDFRYRDTDLHPSELRSIDRLYGFGYHRELNSRAEWSVSYQHINKDTSDNSYDYDDNRVVLRYTHHFGRKHKDRKPVRDVGVAADSPMAVRKGFYE